MTNAVELMAITQNIIRRTHTHTQVRSRTRTRAQSCNIYLYVVVKVFCTDKCCGGSIDVTSVTFRLVFSFRQKTDFQL